MAEQEYLKDRVVFVTGGSKGLGYALVREYGMKGARVVFVARNADDVEEAQSVLRAEGLDVEGRVSDVGDQSAIESTIDAIQAAHGPIDVLVNNAGTIQVGPLDTVRVEDIRTAVDIMLWGVVYPTMKVLPAMRARNEGRIVNITSIGGKISVPHLLPYNTAKFAAVGFSESLQAELGSTGVKVVTVVPGLMRTGSYHNAKFQGETRGEFVWFSLFSSLPGFSIPADSAARRIVRATERGESELILSVPANMIARVKGVVPGITQHGLTLAQRFLPASTGQLGSRTGSDVKRSMSSKLHNRALTLGERAADRLQPGRASSGGKG